MQPAGRAAQSGQTISTGLYISQTINVEGSSETVVLFVLPAEALAKDGLSLRPSWSLTNRKYLLQRLMLPLSFCCVALLYKMEILLGKAEIMRIHVLILQ